MKTKLRVMIASAVIGTIGALVAIGLLAATYDGQPRDDRDARELNLGVMRVGLGCLIPIICGLAAAKCGESRELAHLAAGALSGLAYGIVPFVVACFIKHDQFVRDDLFVFALLAGVSVFLGAYGGMLARIPVPEGHKSQQK